MPVPRVPASECVRGLPATAAPHAPRLPPRPLRRPSAPPQLPLPPLFTAIISTRELSPGRETSGRTTPLIVHWPACQSPAPRSRIAPTALLPAATRGPAPFTRVRAAGTKFRVSGYRGPA